MENQRFDIIYSLGAKCDCAMNLKRASLRLCSGPFDWIGLASFNARIDFILNDFDGFLNADRLIPNINAKGFQEGYVDRDGLIRFVHDFNPSLDFKEAFVLAQAKFKRRIDRFYNLIKDGDKVLFIYQASIDDVSTQELKDALEKLSSKFDKRVHILAILKNSSLKRGTVSIGNVAEGLDICFYNDALFKWRQKAFRKKIYTKYTKLRLKTVVKRKKSIFKGFILVRILTNLIPIKSWRRRLRDSLIARGRYD